MNINSFCTAQQDQADSIIAGSISDQFFYVTDTDFPKYATFTAPSITSGCTSQFYYTVDQSSITQSISKYDIVDVKPDTNHISLNMLDTETTPGEYSITITANHPKGQTFLTSSFSFILRIYAGSCQDSRSSIVLTAPSISD
jgi:hypothetical protein